MSSFSQQQQQLPPQQRPSARNEPTDHRHRPPEQASIAYDPHEPRTIFVNDSPSRYFPPPPSPLHLAEVSEQTANHAAPSYATDGNNEPLTCWICFADSTEDAPTSSPWRAPCPCALRAHESCLLDWIADMENPESSRPALDVATGIRCPQCKSEITLTRPHSYIEKATTALGKGATQLVWPGLGVGLSYALLAGASHHGAHTVRMLFGREDAEAILSPITDLTWFERGALEHFSFVARPLLNGWRGARVEFGLPLIPFTLMASRITLLDPIIPLLPIVFFATDPRSSETLTIGSWPPSAALTLVILPYIRSAYKDALERMWGDRERQWMKELQPHISREEAARERGEIGREPGDDAQADEHAGFEIQVDLGSDDEENFDDNDDNDDAPERNLHDQELGPNAAAPPLHAPPEDEAAREPRGPAQERQPRRRNYDLLDGLSRVAEKMFGALFFPTISYVSGEILRLGFAPSMWTRKPPIGSLPTGLLQTRWGRSIVGGCLFVVLKDALRIYCRWRMVIAFRNRRILDWDRQKKVATD